MDLDIEFYDYDKFTVIPQDNLDISIKQDNSEIVPGDTLSASIAFKNVSAVSFTNLRIAVEPDVNPTIFDGTDGNFNALRLEQLITFGYIRYYEFCFKNLTTFQDTYNLLGINKTILDTEYNDRDSVQGLTIRWKASATRVPQSNWGVRISEGHKYLDITSNTAVGYFKSFIYSGTFAPLRKENLYFRFVCPADWNSFNNLPTVHLRFMDDNESRGRFRIKFSDVYEQAFAAIMGEVHPSMTNFPFARI